MSRTYDPTRKTLTQIVGVVLMIWGIGWAVAWTLAGVGFFVFAIGQSGNGGAGWGAGAIGALVGGLVMAAIGVGKAMAGWILAKPPRQLI